MKTTTIAPTDGKGSAGASSGRDRLPQSTGCTKALSPMLGVRLAWALTGKFSNEASSHSIAELAENDLERIRDNTKEAKESQYVNAAIPTIRATQRILGTIYRWRELNFRENEKLREAYLENAKENIEFGVTVKDFLKSLPTASLATAGGAVAVSELSFFQDLTSSQMGLVYLGFAAAGYFVNMLVIRPISRRYQQRLYVEQDYERNLYYEHYVTQVGTVLHSLYLDLDLIHNRVFGARYSPNTLSEAETFGHLIRGLRGTPCPWIHKHMKDKVITPELWPRCEAGGYGAMWCDLWKEEPGVPLLQVDGTAVPRPSKP